MARTAPPLDARVTLLFFTALALAFEPRASAQTKGLEGDFADPFVVRDGGGFVAFGTGVAGTNVQVARSTDLATWSRSGDALPKLPSWAVPDPRLVWAPSALRRKDRWVLYTTARHAASGFQCIGRAVAARPEGPYVDDSAEPLVCQTDLCGSIDASPFVDREGRAHLLWKSDENADACRAAPRLWSQELAEDGLALVGSPTALLTMDRPWEAPIIEAPSMIEKDGRHYLFYSGGRYEGPGYAVGWASCAGPKGPCVKKTTDAPLLRSDGALLGPGGQELFDDAAGGTWMAYHAWTAPRTSYAAGGARALRLARVTFDESGPIVVPR